MSSPVVPEHLRKQELIFEILSRGEKPEGDVRGLRSQLRACLGHERSWRPEFKVKTEYEACRTRVEELDDELGAESLGYAGPGRTRTLSQLSHWHDRIVLLSSAPGMEAEWKSWAVSAGERLRGALEMASEPRASKDQTRPSAVVGTHGTQPAFVRRCLSPSETPRDEVIEPPRRGSLAPGHERGCEAQYPAFSSFGRLPHPLTSVLSGLPQVDGLDVPMLVHFLGEVLKVQDFPGITDDALLQLLAPLCRRPLSDRVLDCLRRGVCFDQFHAEVLSFFVPGRVMERLRVERVYRPQAPGETLSQFVADIREVARVLRLTLSEQELVQIILEGIKPEERCRLVFCPRPTSFSDLDRLSVISRGVEEGDRHREAMFQGNSGGERSKPSPTLRTAVTFSRKPVTCYGCGERGHVSRSCPRKPTKN